MIKPQGRIGLVCVALALLYGLNAWVQRAIFHNGEFPVNAMSSVMAEHAANNGALDGEMALYLIVNLCIFLGYGLILLMCSRGELASLRSRRWVFVTPCIINVFLLALPASASQDIYSYMAHGVLGLIPGRSPMFHAAYEIGSTPIGLGLSELGWHGRVATTPYGILWTRVEMAIMSVSGENLTTALVLFKTVVVVAGLGSAWFIWIILGRVRPAVQLFGTLVYLWNPVVIIEFANEGHNDALMIFFVLAALAACVARRPATSWVANAMGVMTKYVPVLFLPAQLMYLWRTRESASRFALQILAAAVCVLVIAWVLYAPLWAGVHTFDSLIGRGSPASSASPMGGINFFLRRSELSAHAGAISLAVIMLPFFLIVAWLSWKARDAAELTWAFAWISVLYVVMASPDFWPWYVCMPIALIAAAEPQRLLWLVLLMSVPARFCSTLNILFDHGYISNISARAPTTALSTTVPLIMIAIWAYRRFNFIGPSSIAVMRSRSTGKSSSASSSE